MEKVKRALVYLLDNLSGAGSKQLHGVWKDTHLDIGCFYWTEVKLNCEYKIKPKKKPINVIGILETLNGNLGYINGNLGALCCYRRQIAIFCKKQKQFAVLFFLLSVYKVSSGFAPIYIFNVP